MNLSIRHFKAFLTVVNTRSFTRAAEQMHISQPGLSLMMQDMENQLSCRLLERTTRSVTLTAAGLQLLPSAQHIVDEFEAIAPVLSQISVERRRTLRVGATPIFSASIMPHVYMKLRHAQPSLDLRVVDLPKPDVEKQVRNGELDCGLGIFARRVPEVSRRALFEFDFLYIESRQQPLVLGSSRRKRRMLWSELPDLPFVELPSSSELQQLIDKQKTAAGIGRRADSIRMNNLESLIGMAAVGVGPAILPSFTAPDQLNAQVSTALLTEPVLSMEFHMITKRGRAQPAILELFTQALLEVIAERGERTA